MIAVCNFCHFKGNISHLGWLFI